MKKLQSNKLIQLHSQTGSRALAISGTPSSRTTTQIPTLPLRPMILKMSVRQVSQSKSKSSRMEEDEKVKVWRNGLNRQALSQGRGVRDKGART